MSWGTLDDQYVENEQQQVDSIATGKFFKPKQKDNIIRVLPPWSSKIKWPFKWVWQHSYVDGDGKRKMFVCPKTNNKQDGPKHACVTCDVIIPKLKQGDSDDQELAAELRASVSVMCNIIDRANVAAGAQIWRMSSTKLYPQILSALRDPDYGNITNPKKGHDVKLTRVGELLDTKYSLMMKPKKSSINLTDVEPIDLDDEYTATSNADQIEILEKAYGLTGLDEIEIDEEVEETVSDEGTPFDTDGGTEDDDEPGEDTTEDEDEAPPETEKKTKAKAGGKVKRVAIELDEDLTKAQKTKALKLSIKRTKCFGVLFDEDDDTCAECDGMIKCAVTSSDGD